MSKESMTPSTRILVVEDEPAIADTLCFALSSEGFQAEHVTQGQVALDKLAEHSYGLVVLDIGLPDLSGFEVCRRLRAVSDIPVIFLTARSEEIDRVLGFEVGADDYVLKPFSPREVVARVRVILRRIGDRHTEVGSDDGAIGAFVVDEAGARISFRGEALPLTRYEYLLLRWLLQHPGHVFSRDQLLDAVWGTTSDSYDRTVDTHIKTLRAKLRSIDGSADPIMTHRGMGYSAQP